MLKNFKVSILLICMRITSVIFSIINPTCFSALTFVGFAKLCTITCGGDKVAYTRGYNNICFYKKKKKKVSFRLLGCWDRRPSTWLVHWFCPHRQNRTRTRTSYDTGLWTCCICVRMIAQSRNFCEVRKVCSTRNRTVFPLPKFNNRALRHSPHHSLINHVFLVACRTLSWALRRIGPSAMSLNRFVAHLVVVVAALPCFSTEPRQQVWRRVERWVSTDFSTKRRA